MGAKPQMKTFGSWTSATQDQIVVLNSVVAQLQRAITNIPHGILTVTQIDPATETFVTDGTGVDPTSVGTNIGTLTMDISDGDYGITLRDSLSVDVWKGIASASGTSYTGPYAEIMSAGGTGQLVLATTTTDSADVFYNPDYIAWSKEKLPVLGLVDGDTAMVYEVDTPTSYNTILFLKFNATQGTWVTVGQQVYLPPMVDMLITLANKDAFTLGPNYVVVGSGAWVPLTLSSPVPAPTTLTNTIQTCTGTSAGFPEWQTLKTLPILDFQVFSITKPFDSNGDGYYWFRNTWNRLDFNATPQMVNPAGASSSTSQGNLGTAAYAAGTDTVSWNLAVTPGGLSQRLVDIAPASRLIDTSAPLVGGGTLTNDLLLGVTGATQPSDTTPGEAGVVRLAALNDTSSLLDAVTPAGVSSIFDALISVFTSGTNNRNGYLDFGSALRFNWYKIFSDDSGYTGKIWAGPMGTVYAYWSSAIGLTSSTTRETLVYNVTGTTFSWGKTGDPTTANSGVICLAVGTPA